MKRITVVFVFLLSFSLYGAEDADDSRFLKWKKIDGASFYQVEIMKGERVIQKTETEENFIYLDLPPGEYQFNISVLNKFRKTVAETGWKKLSIESAKQPLIKKFSPLMLYPDTAGSVILYVDAYNIKEKSLFSIESESGNIIAGKVEAVNDSVFKVVFESELILPGKYYLKVENPSGLKDQALDMLVIREKVVPSVEKISEKTFLNKGIYSSIILEGKNFEQNMKIEFRSETSVIKPVSVAVVSDEEVSLILDLSEALPGEYRIYAENPSGLSDLSRRSINIIQRTDENELLMKGFKKDLFTVLAGYTYGYFLENISDYHNYNYDGITGRIQFDFDNDFFNRYIWLFPLGAEIAVGFYPKDIYFYELGFNIYYKSRFQTPLNFIIKGGGGFSVFEEVEHGPEYGRYLSAAGGISLKFYKHLYLEATTGPRTWNVEGDYLNYIESTISAGLTY